ncbi:MAG: GAF domain-containing protein [Acidobacteria bacterium]|nr:GAF domain-containing protein [Acidobacteriota bacterium]
MRSLVTILLLVLLTPSVQAQIYKFKVYNTSSGLPNNAIYYILQDSKGYMWFATNDGVSRYDGIKYQSFSIEQGLADNSVRAILEDKSGNIWFSTRGGVSRYDGKVFTNYSTKDGLPENEIRSSFCSQDGTLWFGTTKGLSRYDGKSFTNYGVNEGLPLSPIWKIVESKPGELWLALRGKGLVKFDGKTFTNYGAKEGLLDENIFDLAKDINNKGLWVATNGGVYYFEDGKFRAQLFNGSNLERVSSVRVDRYGRVWCGTYGSGIYRLEKGVFTIFNHKKGLPDDFITSQTEDYEGNIWWGTQRSGVFYFLSEKFSNYTSSNGIGEGTISSLAQSKDGTLWFSSFISGLVSLSPDGQTKIYGIKDGLVEEELWAVFVDSKGRIWTGGHKGASFYDKGHFTNFSSAKIGLKTRISVFAEDALGRIWMGSDSSASNGIVAYDDSSFTLYDTEKGLVKNQVNGFGTDKKGNLWICTEGGLSRFDGTNFTNYTTKEGLPNKYVHRFYEDEAGNLWIGMAGGISKFDGKTFKHYTIKDGLSDNSVRAITSYNNLLWIGTLRGISTFDGRKFTSYRVKQGLISDSITNGLKSNLGDGLWFSTTEGVVRYQPKEELTLAKAPLVHLTSISAGNEDLSLSLNPNYSIPYNQNTIKFDFIAFSFTDEDAISYSYLLENLDDKWSTPSSERLARFINLPPGDYTFLVKASSVFGIWSEPKAVKIRILSPYWQTWWFILLIVAFIVLSVYGVYAWRIRSFNIRYQKRITGLRQLLESIQVINSQLDLETVLQDIAAQSANLINAEAGGIGLVEGNRVIFHRLWIKDHWEDDPLSFPVGETIAGQAVATAQAIVINEPTQKELDFPDNLKSFYKNGFMDVPIITRTGKVVGVLDIRRPNNRPPFTKLDRQLVEALANQAAVAIENAALYGELEKLYRNEQEITRTLQELDKMKTNFVILASHEMRTPLTILKGYHDVLLSASSSSLTQMQQRSLSVCQRTIDRLIIIANDILEMLKISEGQIILKTSSVDLLALVEEIVEDLRGFVERRNQTLKLTATSPIPKVFVDTEKIRLIMLNLIQNAIKFTHDYGEINITLSQEKELVHIIVEDTGIGIKSIELEKIFDKFYTGEDPLHHSSGKFEFGARGTGLGLAIAKSYVDVHKGKIWAESEGIGKGSKFHLLIPLK